VDWATEGPQVRAWFEAGRVAQCSGTPTRTDVFTVLQVNVIFEADQLASASIYVAEPMADVERVLARSWPNAIEDFGRIVHIVDPDAAPDAVMSAGVGPSAVAGARSVVTFLSRRGLEMPALE
jgi:hypothetical protein